MTTREIIELLEKTRSDAAEDMEIEEISQAELDEISGARGDWFAKLGYQKAF